MKSIVRAGVIVLMGCSISGCAAGGYDPGALQRHLVSIGISRTAAKCAVDHMTETFGDPRLSARADASAAEVKAERALLIQCGVIPPPR